MIDKANEVTTAGNVDTPRVGGPDDSRSCATDTRVGGPDDSRVKVDDQHRSISAADGKGL